MTKWRNRVGEAGAERLLAETLKAGLKVKAIKPAQLKRDNVDTTVQEKNVRHPTDARLYDRARERIVKEAAKHGVKLRQTYARVAKRAMLMQSRYAHTRKPKMAAGETRKLRTWLGRVVREIERKVPRPWTKLADLLHIGRRIHEQGKGGKGRIYSVHEPHVECIAKGKAGKKWEFGCKTSLVATSKGGWVLGAKAFHGNPYDGHTLAAALAQTQAIARRLPAEAYADQGYRKHGYQGETEVAVDKRSRGRTPKAKWKRMKRRAAIEPTIGHLKEHRRLCRNRLHGVEGDLLNPLYSACGMNIGKILKHLRTLCALLLRPLHPPSLSLLPA
jgi:IS5 family transposase